MGDIDGFEYNMIKKIVELNDLNVEYIYIPIEDRGMTYNDMINLLEGGTYDILIGNIRQTYERSKRIIFTSPTGLDIGSFFYRKGTSGGFTGLQLYGLGMNILKVVVFLIIISILFSVTHYYNTPNTISFRESWWRVSATIFGEPGFILHPKFNEKLNIVTMVGLIIRLIIILVSVLTGIFLTSYITSTTVTTSIIDKPFTNISDLYGKTIVVLDGQSEVDILKSYEDMTGMKIKYLNENGNAFEILTTAMESDPTIDAFFMGLAGEEYKSKNATYLKGDIVLEKGFTSFAVNRKHLKLSQMINISIFNMRNERYIRETCEKYFPNSIDVCVQ